VPYSKFTIEKLEKELKVKVIKSDFFEDKKVTPTDWLKQALEFSKSFTLNSEKAKSEFLVTPILIDIRNTNENSFDVFSGENLDVDIERDLNGECDFILTKSQSAITIHSPIFGLVEAKKGEINPNSIAQCIAQMIGAYIFNVQEGNSIKMVFGAVTTGEIWQFMKLEQKDENYLVTIEKRRYYIDSVESILGAIQQVIDFYKES
jgi:hypothetical protein